MSLSKEIINKLEDLVQVFQKEYNVELYFCELLGNRWSFVAGDAQSYLPQRRERITENLGVIVDDSGISEEVVEKIIKLTQKELNS